MKKITSSLVPDVVDVIIRKINELDDIAFDYDRSANELFLA
jgi:hypothetical protein